MEGVRFKKMAINMGQIQRLVLIGLLLLVAAGCGNRAERADRREEEYPLLRRAIQKKREHDIEGAIALSHQALEKRPDLARAHLELGLLYDEPWGSDYLRAIYHYMRYLDMRPESDKREIVEGLVVGAQFAFAASIPDQPSAAVREIARLREEVKVLRERIEHLQMQVEPVDPSTSPAIDRGTTEPRSPMTPPRTPTVQTYVVKTGDSLSLIAGKVYNDATAWEIIYEANRDRLSSPRALRVGQELVIPDRPR